MSSDRPKSTTGFSTVQTLKKRDEFLRLRSGKRSVRKTLILQARNSETRDSDKSKDAIRVGYTVTTKVGNAVVRNRIRRRLREAVRQVVPQKARFGFDYAVIGKRAALRSDFTTLVKDLELALDQIHVNGAKGIK